MPRDITLRLIVFGLDCHSNVLNRGTSGSRLFVCIEEHPVTPDASYPSSQGNTPVYCSYQSVPIWYKRWHSTKLIRQCQRVLSRYNLMQLRFCLFSDYQNPKSCRLGFGGAWKMPPLLRSLHLNSPGSEISSISCPLRTGAPRSLLRWGLGSWRASHGGVCVVQHVDYTSRMSAGCQPENSHSTSTGSPVKLIWPHGFHEYLHVVLEGKTVELKSYIHC